MSVLYSISIQLSPTNDDTVSSLLCNVKGENPHYLLKCYPSHPSRQKFLNNVNHFFRELSFYQTLAKDLIKFQTEIIKNLPENEVIPLAFPRFHGGQAINFSVNGDEENSAVQEKVYHPLDNFILMTDMRKSFSYKMADCRVGLDGNELKLAFNELATLHALSWAYRKKVEWNLVDKYPFLMRSVNKRKTDVWLGILKENVDNAVAAIESVKAKENMLTKAIRDFCEVNGRTVLNYFSGSEETDELELQRILKKNEYSNLSSFDHWRLICHGDLWTNNMLFQYDKETGKPQHVVLVDFPLVKLACPTLDLACLVYTSTRRDVRQIHLEECLQAYHDRFMEICNKLEVECLPSGFSLETIKSRFQTSKLVGLLIAVISLPLNLIGDDKKEGDLEKVDENLSMSEMLQDACTAGVKGSLKLYQEWIVELIEDLYNDGVI